MLMRKFLAMLLIVGAGIAHSETEVDAYGLGDHDPNPEQWVKVDDELSIRVSIVRNKTGELMPIVKSPTTLRLDVSFTTAAGSPDREIHLDCMIYFKDPDARSSDIVYDKPCYTGHLSDGLGKFQPLDLNFKFQPTASDQKGTRAVVIQIHETHSNIHRSIFPTYRWLGGHE
jgi:hypothetical protein